MSGPQPRPGVRNLLLALYLLACLAAQTWPVFTRLGNRIEPYVLGVPYSLAWVVGWVVATFLALGAYHASGPPAEED